MKKLNAKLTPLVKKFPKGIVRRTCGRGTSLVRAWRATVLADVSHVLRVVLFISMVTLTTYSGAGEKINGDANAQYGSAGFINNPSKQLKEQFPVCDEFLKVDWINVSKKAGLATVNYYSAGKLYQKERLTLVFLGDSGPLLADVEEFHQKWKIGQLTSLINRGEFAWENLRGGEYQLQIQAVGKNGKAEILGLHDISDKEEAPLNTISLAEWSKTVCITYPDGGRAFIQEGRRVDKVYPRKMIERKQEILRSWIPGLFFSEYSILVDINMDGKEDFFQFGDVIYSSGAAYYLMKVDSTAENGFDTVVTSPTNTISCHLPPNAIPIRHYLTTDGKSFYLDNLCNLTELTREGNRK